MTHLCTPIFVRTWAQAREDAVRAAQAGADMIEYRIDAITDEEMVRTIVNLSPLPCILTQRSVEEGGHATATPQARAEFLAKAPANRMKTVYLDFEVAGWHGISQDQRDLLAQRPLVLSHHDLVGRPPRLTNLIMEMDAAPAAVNKIVWTARSIRDNLEAFELLLSASRPTIALCMGEAGMISRVLAKKFHAFLTFAPLSDESATANGQVPIEQLKNLYRWDTIGAKTRVYGVIGSPIGHSLSPHVHNAAFAATGEDAVYLPLLVAPGYESFKAFMETFVPFAGLDLSGLSVTIPHKENALRYLRERGAAVDELAERVGAVNTISIDRSAGGAPVLRGTTTDFDAIIDTVTQALRIERPELKGKKVAVLGAGGTGRTAAAAMSSCGARVGIYNRTLDRAAGLTQALSGAEQGISAATLDDLAGAKADIFIQTTSLGMHPVVDQSCFDVGMPQLGEGCLVFDTIYTPMQTKLMRTAQEAGAVVVGGLEMFVHQAQAQFKTWIGQSAPAGVMRAAAEKQLRDTREPTA
jgi:3-dehydroquinate dehydratase/shikimate dehydrogenase